MRQQLADGEPGRGPSVDVAAYRIAEVHSARVAQPQHRHRDEGLGDRPAPVLHIAARHRTVHAAAAARPHQRAATDQARGHRREPQADMILHKPSMQQPAVLSLITRLNRTGSTTAAPDDAEFTALVPWLHRGIRLRR